LFLYWLDTERLPYDKKTPGLASLAKLGSS
jgi:hypothetical protein